MSTICERQIAIFNSLNLTILLWYIYKLLQIKDFMKLSTKGRYAVMALADIAKFDKDMPVTRTFKRYLSKTRYFPSLS